MALKMAKRRSMNDGSPNPYKPNLYKGPRSYAVLVLALVIVLLLLINIIMGPSSIRSQEFTLHILSSSVEEHTKKNQTMSLQ
jgi:hypothetical protein